MKYTIPVAAYVLVALTSTHAAPVLEQRQAGGNPHCAVDRLAERDRTAAFGKRGYQDPWDYDFWVNSAEAKAKAQAAAAAKAKAVKEDSSSGDAELERRFNGLPYEGSDELAQSDEHHLDERVLSFQEGDDEDEARAYLKRGVIEDEFEEPLRDDADDDHDESMQRRAIGEAAVLEGAVHAAKPNFIYNIIKPFKKTRVLLPLTGITAGSVGYGISSARHHSYGSHDPFGYPHHHRHHRTQADFDDGTELPYVVSFSGSNVEPAFNNPLQGGDKDAFVIPSASRDGDNIFAKRGTQEIFYDAVAPVAKPLAEEAVVLFKSATSSSAPAAKGAVEVTKKAAKPFGQQVKGVLQSKPTKLFGGALGVGGIGAGGYALGEHHQHRQQEKEQALSDLANRFTEPQFLADPSQPFAAAAKRSEREIDPESDEGTTTKSASEKGEAALKQKVEPSPAPSVDKNVVTEEKKKGESVAPTKDKSANIEELDKRSVSDAEVHDEALAEEDRHDDASDLTVGIDDGSDADFEKRAPPVSAGASAIAGGTKAAGKASKSFFKTKKFAGLAGLGLIGGGLFAHRLNKAHQDAANASADEIAARSLEKDKLHVESVIQRRQGGVLADGASPFFARPAVAKALAAGGVTAAAGTAGYLLGDHNDDIGRAYHNLAHHRHEFPESDEDPAAEQMFSQNAVKDDNEKTDAAFPDSTRENAAVISKRNVGSTLVDAVRGGIAKPNVLAGGIGLTTLLTGSTMAGYEVGKMSGERRKDIHVYHHEGAEAERADQKRKHRHESVVGAVHDFVVPV